MTFEILLKRRDFIIIYKPCGMSVHKDGAEVGLTELIARQLGVAQVWLVHRLDKVTSGLSGQKPKKKQGLIIGDMRKVRNGAWKLCQSRENPAITRFQSVSCEANLRLFVLQPKTGKTHQLRVAMKSLGSPILGDVLYGKNASAFDRTYLHAARLQFEFNGETFDVFAAPQEGAWWRKASVLAKMTEKPFLGNEQISV